MANAKDLRASDADREQVAHRLRLAVGEGRLTLAECDERLVATYASRTYGDLHRVVADLPSSTAAPLPVPVDSRSQLAGRDAWLSADRCAERDRRRLRVRIGRLAWLAIVLTSVWAVTGHPVEFWPAIALVPYAGIIGAGEVRRRLR